MCVHVWCTSCVGMCVQRFVCVRASDMCGSVCVCVGSHFVAPTVVGGQGSRHVSVPHRPERGGGRETETGCGIT